MSELGSVGASRRRGSAVDVDAVEPPLTVRCDVAAEFDVDGMAPRGDDFATGAAAFDVWVTGGGVARISFNLNSRVSVGADVAFGNVISVTGAIVVVHVEVVGAIAVAVDVVSVSVTG